MHMGGIVNVTSKLFTLRESRRGHSQLAGWRIGDWKTSWVQGVLPMALPDGLWSFQRALPASRGPLPLPEGPDRFQKGPYRFQKGPYCFQKGPNRFQKDPY